MPVDTPEHPPYHTAVALLKSKRILIVLASLVLLATWAVYRSSVLGRVTRPNRDARAVGGRRAVAVSPAEDTPKGTTAHPLDRVIIGLRRASGRARMTVRASGPVRILDGITGAGIGALSAGGQVALAVDPVGPRVIARAPGWERRRPSIRLAPVAGAQLRVGSSRYAGDLVVRVRGMSLALTNDIDVESYLAGVVPGEVPNRFALEAQKALAVAARTYSLVKRGKHAAEGFDLCDGTHCQMYLGVLSWAPQGKRAVRETRGLLAWHDDQPIHTFYSADCGGRTANNEDLPIADMPHRPLPYLRALADGPGPGQRDYCASSPFHQWTRLVTVRALEAALNRRAATHIGTLTGVRFTTFDPSGRVKRVRLEGLMWPPTTNDPRQRVPTNDRGRVSSLVGTRCRGSFIGPPPPIVREVSGWEFRRSLGWRVLRSTLVRVRHTAVGQYQFTGKGNGHGVGLCQIGADGMASPPYGRSFREILDHYYPGVRVAPLARRIGRAAPLAAAPRGTGSLHGSLRELLARSPRR